MTRRKPKPKPEGVKVVAWSSWQHAAAPLDPDSLYSVEESVDPLVALLHRLPPRPPKPAPDTTVRLVPVKNEDHWVMVNHKKYARESNTECLARIIAEARDITDQSTYKPLHSEPEKKDEKAPWLTEPPIY